MMGRFIAVVGPSGVGKDSVMEAMAARAPQIRLARRVITRPSDAGGEDFDGVTIEKFEAMRGAGAFALWWSAHGLFYGIPRAIYEDLAAGRDVVANLSRGVLVQAQARFDGFEVISLKASKDVLAGRLARRGREDQAEVTRRLERANFALPDRIKASMIDNSGTLDDTVARALALIYPVKV